MSADRAPEHDLTTAACTALACLDLTSLNDADAPADIEALCARANGRFGPTAAVCVWPRFAAQARALLPPGIAVAAVANFPDGSSDIERALRDTGAIVDAGAQEVDLVLPYRDLPKAPALLATVRRACMGLRLKVILETGELREPALISLASRIALEAGADFLKTSTGKTPHSASPGAARLMLQAIAAYAEARSRVGFKPSGGIRTVADAALYMALVAEHLGPAAVTPARFRIGASALLNDIEDRLQGRPDGAAAQPSAAADRSY
jgi:deoxyribose-phosphate aldolase